MVVSEGRAGRGRSDSGSAIDWPQMQWPGWAESQKRGCRDGVGGGARTSTGHTAHASCRANPSSRGLRESSPTRVGLCLTCAVWTLSAALMLRRVPLLPVPSAQASPRAHHVLQEAHPYLTAVVPREPLPQLQPDPGGLQGIPLQLRATRQGVGALPSCHRRESGGWLGGPQPAALSYVNTVAAS